MWTVTIARNTDNKNVVTATATNGGFTFSDRLKLGGADEGRFVTDAKAAYDKQQTHNSEVNASAKLMEDKLNA